MKSYLISNFDPDTWSLLKAACAYNKITLKSFFHETINAAVSEFVSSDFHKDIVKTYLEKEDGL